MTCPPLRSNPDRQTADTTSRLSLHHRGWASGRGAGESERPGTVAWTLASPLEHHSPTGGRWSGFALPVGGWQPVLAKPDRARALPGAEHCAPGCLREFQCDRHGESRRREGALASLELGQLWFL